MLKLYNKEHVAVGALTNLKDYKIEYLLNGEDQLEFSLSICDEDINLVEEEGYARNKYNEYVIKAVDPSQNFKRFSCIVNIEAIKAKSIKNFEISNNTITESIRLAIAGTGWILADNNISKRRTVRVKNTDALGVLREIRKVFMIDYRFDAINKVIYVYEHFGSDKGVYFSDELNLKTLTVPSDTYDYATRLYCYGKDGINITSVNGGKAYVENFQYSNKVIEKIWTDDRYTVAENLKVDAEAKLEELSKPKRSYRAEIIDLARNNKEYKFLDFFLGDTITLLSKAEKFRDKQRIVKYIEYPNDPSKNTCELGNTRLTFEELQKENEAKNQVVNNITSDNGTINGETIDSIKSKQISDFETSVAKITNLTVINADITNLKAQNVTITGELNTVKANVGALTSNVATIDKLTVTHSASINDLQANKASITQLEAVNATIQVLEANVGKIETLVNGNLSSENIQAGGITSDKLTIANGFIKNAMIASLDVSKVNAGDISTNKFRITSDSGNMLISDNTIQIRDNSRVRVQIGKDASNDYNMYVWDSKGNLMFDATGLKEGGIKDKIIRDDMVSDNANISGGKLNISSVVTSINNGTTTIKGSKVMLDETNQTLDIGFNSLKTEVQGMEIGGTNLISSVRDTFRNNSSGTFDETTNTWNLTIVNGAGDTWGGGVRIGGKNVLIPYGKTFIVSFEVFVPVACKWNVDVNCYPVEGDNWAGNDNDYTELRKTSSKDLEPNKWTKCWFSYVNKHAHNTSFKDLYDNSNFGIVNNTGSAMNYKIKNIMGELATKPSDWSECPYDTNKKIDALKEITTTQSTNISVMQGQIATAINNTQIVKDGQTILLKDDYNRTVQTVNSMSSTISQHTTTISQHTGQITTVTGKVNTIERDLTSLVARVGDNETNIKTVGNKVDNLQVGGTNLIPYARDFSKEWGINGQSFVGDGRDTGFKMLGVRRSDYVSGNPRHQSHVMIRQGLDKGTSITFSGWYYINTEIPMTGTGPNDNIAIREYDSATQNHYDICNVTLDKTKVNQWVRFEVTDTTRYGYCKYLQLLASLEKNGFFFLYKPKLEIGNKATDFSDCPTDRYTEIVTTKSTVAGIVLDLEGITQSVKDVETTTTNLGNASNQNLLSNADFLDLENGFPRGWQGAIASEVYLDVGGRFEGCNVVKIDVSGLTADRWTPFQSPHVVAQEGAEFVASVYVFPIVSTINVNLGIEIEYFNSSGGRIKTDGAGFKSTLLDRQWQRLSVKGTAPAGTVKARLRIHPARNGHFNVAKPMLQLGTTLTGWTRGIDVLNIETRMQYAETKITKNSIISTVSSEFYTKGQSDLNYASKTIFEQTKDDFLFKFQNGGQANELYNSDFSQGNRAWIISDYNKVATETKAGYGGGGIPADSGIRIVDCVNSSGNARQTFTPKNPNAVNFTVSCWAHMDNVVNSGTTGGYSMAHLYCQINHKGGQTSYHNFDIRTKIGNSSGWKRVVWTDTTQPQMGAIESIEFYVYKRNTTGTMRVTQIMFTEGAVDVPWCPANGEVYTNTTKIDGSGISVIHDDGARSILDHEKIEFTSSNNRKTLRIKNGGLNFYDPTQAVGEMVGFIKPSVMAQHGKNGVTISTYSQGEYIALGWSYSNVDTEWVSTPQILICSQAFGDNYLGVNMWGQTYFHNGAYFRYPMHVKASTALNFNHTLPGRAPSQIWGNSSNLDLNIYGNDAVNLGIQYGTEFKTGLKIVEDATSSSKITALSYYSQNWNGYSIVNANISRELQAATPGFATFLRVMSAPAQNIYTPYTYNKDQIRYTCSETQHITNYELMVEVPQIIAENMTTDYHISIGKISFGDYRIKEKTPYYFVVESDRETFSFTYEIVCTTIEKPDTNVSLASLPYISEPETVKKPKLLDYSYVDEAEIENLRNNINKDYKPMKVRTFKPKK